jgi:hypothetical protein
VTDLPRFAHFNASANDELVERFDSQVPMSASVTDSTRATILANHQTMKTAGGESDEERPEEKAGAHVLKGLGALVFVTQGGRRIRECT